MLGFYSTSPLERPHKSKTHGSPRGSEQTKFTWAGESFDIYHNFKAREYKIESNQSKVSNKQNGQVFINKQRINEPH